MVKGLHIDEKLGTTNSYKSGNILETVDSVKWVDSKEPNFMKAKWTGYRNEGFYLSRDVNTVTSRELRRG